MHHPTLEATLTQYVRDNYPCEITPRVELKANPHLWEPRNHAYNPNDTLGMDWEFEVYHNHPNDFIRWYNEMACHNPSCTYDAVATVWYTPKYATVIGITKCGQLNVWMD